AGETVVMTGTGWQPGETVSLVMHEVPTFHPDPTFTAVADANGGWILSEFVVQGHDVGVTFTLTGTGQSSGWTASTTFSDAIGTNLDQFQNGTTTKSPEWANGNINGNNSCYSEGDVAPYRYFVNGLGA